MSNNPSLLEKIKSKYILQSILSIAYRDIKPLVKLLRNKNLFDRLDINLEEIKPNYKIVKFVDKKHPINYIFLSINDIILFIIFFIYMILRYSRGRITDEIRKPGDDNRKKFVDAMDNYILILYFIFIIASNIINYLSMVNTKISLKGITKYILIILFFIIHITYYILFIINFHYSKNIIYGSYLGRIRNRARRKYTDENIIKHLWFYDFDIAIIIIAGILLIYYLTNILAIILDEDNYDDYKEIYLKQINGINITELEVPLEFDNLNKKKQNYVIFKKDNIERYKYKLNENQINLISKLNDIRRKNNISLFEYKEEEKLPDYIMNKKTEFVFYPLKNLYKLRSNFFVFKYPKNEFRKVINKQNILSIITNNLLDKINIIESNAYEYISIYNNIMESPAKTSKFISKIPTKIPTRKPTKIPRGKIVFDSNQDEYYNSENKF